MYVFAHVLMDLIIQYIEVFPYVSAVLMRPMQNAETLILEYLRLSYSSLCMCVWGGGHSCAHVCVCVCLYVCVCVC